MRALGVVLLLLVAGAALGQASVFEARSFDDEVSEKRYRSLIDELRCLVCQNQSIADSNADLARQLRDEVHEMIAEGASDQEIVSFMVERYGDFVLFDPPMKAVTWVLWFGPFGFLLLGLGYLFFHIRRRQRAAAGAPGGGQAAPSAPESRL